MSEETEYYEQQNEFKAEKERAPIKKNLVEDRLISMTCRCGNQVRTMVRMTRTTSGAIRRVVDRGIHCLLCGNKEPLTIYYGPEAEQFMGQWG